MRYAHDQLHRVISAGDGTAARSGEVIARQAHALDRESQYFAQLANRVLSNQPINQRLQNAIQNFAGTAHHFHEAVEKTNNPQHLSEDFSDLQQAWQQVVQLLNSSRQSAYLYRQALRVSQTYNELNRRIAQGGQAQPNQGPALQYQFRLGH